MMSPNNHHIAATDLLAEVDQARDQMVGQMVSPEMAMQIQAALALDVAIAQVHATLATRKESEM